jgi:hypothetical protein
VTNPGGEEVVRAMVVEERFAKPKVKLLERRKGGEGGREIEIVNEFFVPFHRSPAVPASYLLRWKIRTSF